MPSHRWRIAIKFLRYTFAVVLLTLPTACLNSEPEYLDSFESGDIQAKPGNIKIFGLSKKKADTKFKIETYIHPRIKKLYPYDDGQIELRHSQFLRGKLFKLLRPKWEDINDDTRFDFNLEGRNQGPTVDNNGTNIIITQHIGLNKTGEAYKLTVTMRQGKYFWGRSVERGAGYEHPKVTKPAPVNPIEGNMYGEGFKTMEETRIGALQYEERMIVSEIERLISVNAR